MKNMNQENRTMSNSAIIDPSTGRPFERLDAMRHGSQIDAGQLPECADTSFDKHEKFIEQLRNNVTLRENLAKADKQLGSQSICLLHFDRRYERPMRVIDNVIKKVDSWRNRKKKGQIKGDDNYAAYEAMVYSAKRAQRELGL
jgi:hypothetical protein